MPNHRTGHAHAVGSGLNANDWAWQLQTLVSADADLVVHVPDLSVFPWGPGLLEALGVTVVSALTCEKCGRGISRFEDGRCAWCRMAARGDDQLLAHDSRGWLADGGPGRQPCGCGCGQTLAAIVGDTGRGRDLVRAEVRQLDALERMDAGEPQQPGPVLEEPDEVGSPPPETGRTGFPSGSSSTDDPGTLWGLKRSGRGWAWTKAGAIAAIQRFTTLNGRQPTMSDSAGDPLLPSQKGAESAFGSWSAALAAARVDQTGPGSLKIEGGPAAAPESDPGPTPQEDAPAAREPARSPALDDVPAPTPEPELQSAGGGFMPSPELLAAALSLSRAAQKFFLELSADLARLATHTTEERPDGS